MSETTKCHKCGCTNNKLIHHHKSYDPEIIVMVCRSCHTKLHLKLRDEGKCNISPIELREISNNSKHRRNYNKTRMRSEHARILHNNTDKKYRNTHKRMHKYFSTNILPNVQLLEQITISNHGNNINIWSRFQANNNKKLIFIDI